MAKVDLEGVGICVFHQNKVLTLEERIDKPKANRKAGMISIPMETLEGNESHLEGLIRLFNEEVRPDISLNTDPTANKLCKMQIAPGVWLHAYLLLAKSEKIETGFKTDEVTNIGWRSIKDLLEIPGNQFKLRPGAREVIICGIGASILDKYAPRQILRPKYSLVGFPNS